MRTFFLARFIETGLKNILHSALSSRGKKKKRVGFLPSLIHRAREQIFSPSHSLLMTASKALSSLFTLEIWSRLLAKTADLALSKRLVKELHSERSFLRFREEKFIRMTELNFQVIPPITNLGKQRNFFLFGSNQESHSINKIIIEKKGTAWSLHACWTRMLHHDSRNNRQLPKHKLNQNAKNLQCLLKFGLIEDDVTVFQWPWNSESR